MRRLLTASSLSALLAASACATTTTTTTTTTPTTASTGFNARLDGYAYPHEVQLLPVTVQGHPLELAYMDVAPTTSPNGHTVVLLHGKNFSGAYWAETIALLAGQGFRVVAPDQIGFGKSSKPVDIQYSFQLLATTTKALLDHLGLERVVVVGHSMGGMLGTRFALMFPEHVEKLALVNPIGLEDWKQVVPYRSVDEHYAVERKATPDTVRRYMQQAYFDGRWLPAYEPLIAIQAGWVTGPDSERMAMVTALTSDMVFTQPVVHELPLLKVPTLLIIGTRDRTAIGKAWAPAEVQPTLGLYEQLGKKAAAAIPGAQLVELEGVGHAPQVEAWDRYVQALTTFLLSGS
ncbi:MAG TPA: alpha/beta hydrolase [Myxococcota bacterium]